MLKKIIVVDPGHGGNDPGALGKKSNEKTLTLNIAKALKAELEKAGYRVILTRGRDAYVSLGMRCLIANNAKANFFLSIHANSAVDNTASGVEVLYKRDDLKDEAEQLAKDISVAMGFKNRGAKYRNDLYVLNGTRMPSLLVEVGFISNPAEEEKLLTNVAKIAQVIAARLRKFDAFKSL